MIGQLPEEISAGSCDRLPRMGTKKGYLTHMSKTSLSPTKRLCFHEKEGPPLHPLAKSDKDPLHGSLPHLKMGPLKLLTFRRSQASPAVHPAPNPPPRPRLDGRSGRKRSRGHLLGGKKRRVCGSRLGRYDGNRPPPLKKQKTLGKV